jgi:hypothetical protein
LEEEAADGLRLCSPLLRGRRRPRGEQAVVRLPPRRHRRSLAALLRSASFYFLSLVSPDRAGSDRFISVRVVAGIGVVRGGEEAGAVSTSRRAVRSSCSALAYLGDPVKWGSDYFVLILVLLLHRVCSSGLPRFRRRSSPPCPMASSTRLL